MENLEILIAQLLQLTNDLTLLLDGLLLSTEVLCKLFLFFFDRTFLVQVTLIGLFEVVSFILDFQDLVCVFLDLSLFLGCKRLKVRLFNLGVFCAFRVGACGSHALGDVEGRH